MAAFRNRPLDAGPYTYIWVDALTQKVREGGRIVNVAVIVATGVNADGHREILGVDLITTEDGAGWTAFLRGLVARGLSGVALVVSDAHQGLVDAIASVLPGATWQRCRVHFVRNVHTRVPKTAQSMVGALIRSIFEQPDAEQVHAQHARVVEQLTERFPDAAAMLVEAEADILAFASFPKEHWRQIWSNNPQERLNKEIRRRTDVVGHLPQPARCHPTGRCCACRTARRVGRRPALHGHRVPGQGPAPGDGRNRARRWIWQSSPTSVRTTTEDRCGGRRYTTGLDVAWSS